MQNDLDAEATKGVGGGDISSGASRHVGGTVELQRETLPTRVPLLVPCGCANTERARGSWTFQRQGNMGFEKYTGASTCDGIPVKFQSKHVN